MVVAADQNLWRAPCRPSVGPLVQTSESTTMPVSAALHAALDRSHIVVEFDLDEHLIEVNSNFLTLMGATRESAIGQLHEHFLPQSADAVQSRQITVLWKQRWQPFPLI